MSDLRIDMQATIEELEDEIERLQDDLAISESNYVAVVDRNLKVEAEIERLHEIIAKRAENNLILSEDNYRLQLEIERLDAALNWVLNYCREEHRDGDAGRLAAITTLVSNTLKGEEVQK